MCRSPSDLLPVPLQESRLKLRSNFDQCQIKATTGAKSHICANFKSWVAYLVEKWLMLYLWWPPGMERSLKWRNLMVTLEGQTRTRFFVWLHLGQPREPTHGSFDSYGAPAKPHHPSFSISLSFRGSGLGSWSGVEGRETGPVSWRFTVGDFITAGEVSHEAQRSEWKENVGYCPIRGGVVVQVIFSVLSMQHFGNAQGYFTNFCTDLLSLYGEAHFKLI